MTNQASPAMRRLHDDIADHLEAIEKLFVGPCKVTLLVRDPDHPDGSRDVHVTNDDDTDAAIAAIRRVVERGVHVGGPPLPRTGGA
jgi:hypothetical protein